MARTRSAAHPWLRPSRGYRGRPRLFRADRVAGVSVTPAEARRRQGVELEQVWKELRRQVEDRSEGVRIAVRVRREGSTW
ncbi:hypothetical protein [Nonomuraea dietziae]|uniref:hypothetical protein n=1 Tax=Nonomuraea dietziae TaxID=65515 RepID=UPI003428A3E4